MTARRGLLAALLLGGCATSRAIAPDPAPPEARAEVRRSGAVTVHAVALGAEESRQRFGIAMNEAGVQPVWLRVVNADTHTYWVLPISVDREYFSPMEAVRRVAGRAADEALVARIRDVALVPFVRPGSVVEGVIYARADEGLKAITLRLIGSGRRHDFPFVLRVPGLARPPIPGQETIYPGQTLPDLDDAGLLRFASGLPCCAQAADGRAGDPVNFILVGPIRLVQLALASRGWTVAEVVSHGAAARMTAAFLLGRRMANAPVSDLYLFGRPHDVAYQKAREVLDERNHLRLWLAPVTWQGQPVWAGQISRDIAVKPSGRLWPPTTHEIDPDVDDARFYLLQDLIAAERVARLALADGVGAAERRTPRRNAEDDPYFTDGLRTVIVLTETPTDATALRLFGDRLPW
jgi:hypothetical protein